MGGGREGRRELPKSEKSSNGVWTFSCLMEVGREGEAEGGGGREKILRPPKAAEKIIIGSDRWSAFPQEQERN